MTGLMILAFFTGFVVGGVFVGVVLIVLAVAFGLIEQSSPERMPQPSDDGPWLPTAEDEALADEAASDAAMAHMEHIEGRERDHELTQSPPCHQLPREQWCDRYGPAGFMGHTCTRRRTHARRGKQHYLRVPNTPERDDDVRTTQLRSRMPGPDPTTPWPR